MASCERVGESLRYLSLQVREASGDGYRNSDTNLWPLPVMNGTLLSYEYMSVGNALLHLMSIVPIGKVRHHGLQVHSRCGLERRCELQDNCRKRPLAYHAIRDVLEEAMRDWAQRDWLTTDLAAILLAVLWIAMLVVRHGVAHSLAGWIMRRVTDAGPQQRQ
jgi:hypothetical protein